MIQPIYLHLPAGEAPPQLDLAAPFKAVVIIEQAVTDDWRNLVSKWLVEAGCLYMMAWGLDCSLWDDSVDHANLQAFDHDHVPDDRFVDTTWHEREPLADVFWFAGNCADHDAVNLEGTLIIHISPENRAAEMLAVFERAQQL